MTNRDLLLTYCFVCLPALSALVCGVVVTGFETVARWIMFRSVLPVCVNQFVVINLFLIFKYRLRSEGWYLQGYTYFQCARSESRSLERLYHSCRLLRYECRLRIDPIIFPCNMTSSRWCFPFLVYEYGLDIQMFPFLIVNITFLFFFILVSTSA